MADTKGPWDQATWIPGGSLFVTKGDMEGQVDVSGSSGQQKEAVAIATLMVPRFGHPLDYDGAKAVAMAPKPTPHPESACDVLPTTSVEAAIGALSGAPEADADGTTCRYHVASAKGMRTYSVEYVWQGGRKNYNMLVHGMSTLGSVMGGNIPMGGMDSIPGDSTTRNMIGGLMKMVGGGGSKAATGAVTQVGLKTDTALKGPWDNASLQHGTQLLAVKNDVMVGWICRAPTTTRRRRCSRRSARSCDGRRRDSSAGHRRSHDRDCRGRKRGVVHRGDADAIRGRAAEWFGHDLRPRRCRNRTEGRAVVRSALGVVRRAYPYDDARVDGGARDLRTRGARVAATHHEGGGAAPVRDGSRCAALDARAVDAGRGSGAHVGMACVRGRWTHRPARPYRAVATRRHAARGKARHVEHPRDGGVGADHGGGAQAPARRARAPNGDAAHGGAPLGARRDDDPVSY